MSRRSTIYNALPIVAQTYGEKFGVKVQLGDQIAHTDGQTIVVPNVPENYPNMDVIWGYLAHEAAHVRFTDFSVPREKGIHGFLANVFEDARIERAMVSVFPGTVKTLHEVTRYMIDAGHYQHVTDQDSPSTVLADYCLYWSIANVLGQPEMLPFASTAFAALQKVVSQGVITRLSVLLSKLSTISSTQDAVNLASAVVKMIEEEKQKEDQKQEQAQSSSDTTQGDDPDQADDPQSQSDTQTGDGQSQTGASGDPSGDASDASAQSADGSGSGQNSTSSTDNNSSAAVSQALAQILAAGDDQLPDQKEALREELSSVSRKNESGSYSTIKQAVEIQNRVYEGGQALRNAKADSIGIRQQLLGLVQASQRHASLTHRRGKSLAHTKLSRVMQGDTRVFRQPVEKRSPNTAVHILVDISGSMNGSTLSGSKRLYEVAQEAALTIALALEGIQGVNPAVTYFGGSAEEPNFSAMKHGQRVSQNAGRFILPPQGSTPMAEAIWYGAYELSKTREQRKLMIVITDGEPNNEAAVKSVVDLCERSGIELIGIGLITHAVKQFFQRSIVIQDVNDLRKTLFKLMENSLAIAA